MQRNKWIVIFVGAIVILSFLYVGLKYIVPSGSYCYAESYEFDTTEPVLINAIENLKKNNPQYFVPNVYVQGRKIEGLTDGRSDSNDYWYQIYFYFPTENQIIHFWTRPANEKGKTELGFVGINEGLNLGNWKDVNDKFSRTENNKVKREFEQRILNQLGLKYNDKGNGMKIGFIQL